MLLKDLEAYCKALVLDGHGEEPVEICIQANEVQWDVPLDHIFAYEKKILLTNWIITAAIQEEADVRGEQLSLFGEES